MRKVLKEYVPIRILYDSCVEASKYNKEKLAVDLTHEAMKHRTLEKKIKRPH